MHIPLILMAIFGPIGAFWRRWFGGYLGGRRWTRMITAPILCIPAFFFLPWVEALFVTALITVSWTPGHEWTDPFKMCARYGYIPAIIAVILAYFHQSVGYLAFAAVGPMIAAVYATAQNRLFQSRIETFGRLLNKITEPDIYDGPIAFAELGAGLIVYTMLPISLWLGTS